MSIQAPNPKKGSKVVVNLNYGTGTIRGEVEHITLNGVWVRLENGNPRLVIAAQEAP